MKEDLKKKRICYLIALLTLLLHNDKYIDFY